MEIPDFYRGRSVLVTGATGFVGTAIIEKLLRCCPDVERIYILVRPKRGLDPQQRVNALLSRPVLAGCPVAKVTAVAGDVTLPSLGLSIEDRDVVVANVSVVLHSAATVSFTEPLRVALQMNVQAADYVLQLARSMRNLVALVHVSTAYSNCERPEIREEVYPPPADVQDMLRRCREEDEQTLDRDTPKLLGDRPNTYTFTKALAENLWAEDASDLPVAIVRPSIVGWAWRHPFPGWVDKFNGIIGPYTAIASGTMRSVNSDPRCVSDIVPVDIVVGAVLVAAWRTAVDRPADAALAGDPDRAAPRAPAPPTVYNCVTGASNPVTWGKLIADWLKEVRANVAGCAVWYPGCTFTPSTFGHSVRVATLMLLPAYFYDVIAPLFGRKANLLELQRKSKKLLDSLCYFSTRQWSFEDHNMRRLWSLMSARDRILFPLDVTAIDWEAYMRTSATGSKRILLRDKEDHGPRTGLYLVHQTTLFVWYSLLGSLLCWVLRPYVAKVWPSHTLNFLRFILSKI